MYKFLLVLSAFLFSLSGVGQYNYFSHMFLDSLSIQQYAYDVFVTDSNYIVTGTSRHPIDRGICLMKFDLDGNLIQHQDFMGTIDYGPFLGENLKFSNDYFYLAGLRQGSMNWMKWDSNFEIIDSTSHVYPDSCVLEHRWALERDTDSTFITLGQKVYENDGDPWTDYGILNLTRIQDNGEIIEMVPIDPGTADFYWANQVKVLPNDEYMVFGLQSPPEFERMTYRIDSNGQIINQFIWNDSIFQPGGFVAYQEPDSVHFTFLYSETDSISIYGHAYFHLGMMRYNAITNDVIWTQEYDHSFYLGYGGKLIPTLDGGYTFSGTRSAGNDMSSEGFILKVDSTGQEEWFDTYKHVTEFESQNVLLTVKNAPDGGYIGVGYTHAVQWDNNEPPNTWILKLDPCGYAQQNGCPKIVNVPQTEPSSFEIYPNPCNQGTNIVWQGSPAQVEVRDSYGRVLFVHSLSEGANYIDTSQLTRGYYILSGLSEGIRFTSYLVVQ